MYFAINVLNTKIIILFNVAEYRLASSAKYQAIIRVISQDNRPFYICVLSDLALDGKRGLGWLCFDTNLTTFHM